MEDRRQRRMHGLPEVGDLPDLLNVFFSSVYFSLFKPLFFLKQYLYGSQARHLSYNDFINKELILFSNSDNERSIPSLVDGMYSG